MANRDEVEKANQRDQEVVDSEREARRTQPPAKRAPQPNHVANKDKNK